MRYACLQFRLKWMFLAIALLGVASGYMACVKQQYDRELHVIEQLQDKGRVLYFTENSLRKVVGCRWLYPTWWDRVRSVAITADKCDGDDLRLLCTLEDMTSIRVSDCPNLTDGVLADLVEAHPLLENLSVRDVPITDAGAQTICRLEHLTTLRCSFTKIADVSIQQFTGLRHLIMLDVSGNRITDRSIRSFMQMPQLQDLDVSWTEMTPAAAEHLQVARPGLSVNATGLSED